MPDGSEREVAPSQARPAPAYYANNVQFQPSVWDLKILLGQLDRNEAGEVYVEPKASVTLAWPEVKVLAYFLLANMFRHEIEHGEIALPGLVRPPRPDPEDPEINADMRALNERLGEIHKQLFGG